MVTTINKYTIRFDGSSDGGSSGIAAIPHLQRQSISAFHMLAIVIRNHADYEAAFR